MSLVRAAKHSIMLYTFVVATLVASASAFNGPMAARPSASRAAVSMDGSWRRSFDGRGSFAPGAGAPGTSAVTGGMSVPAACKFMESEPSVSFAAKKAFLLEKGVPEFVIIEAACTAPDSTLVL